MQRYCTLKLKVFLLLSFLIFLLMAYSLPLNATIRYVSHTGSSTPPYTTWETASDSIQKCINYSVDGDTIIVANGIYKERLNITRDLTLLGMSMDSTFIDGRGLVGTGQDSIITMAVYKSFEIRNFLIMGHIGTILAQRDGSSMKIIGCRLENAALAISCGYSINNYQDELIIKNVRVGIIASDLNNTSSFYTSNNLILIGANNGYGINHSGGGLHEITNNIILYTDPQGTSQTGIDLLYGGRTFIKNNIIAGFNWNHFYQDLQQLDSAYIINNLFGYSRYVQPLGAILDISDGRKIVKNNLIVRSSTGEGIEVRNYILNPDYNLYWDLGQRYDGNIIPGNNEIVADPMVVKDTMPNNQMDFDYHLQAYSPAIDAGDPDILDTDGSRSDIGAYGGPRGENYTYLDLPPRSPVNVNATVDTNIITITWNRNSEADTSHYNVYRDSIANFTIEPSKLVSSQSDTIYIQPNPQNVESLYYKITAVDQQGNQSLPSEEVGVLITSVDSYQVVVEDYILYQNYPNPFNPSTRISYKLRERSFIVLKVYDIKGELVQVLVNREQEPGYYEVDFYGSANDPFPGQEINSLASGIYLYRIEVTGKGTIPVYSETKKMLFLK